MPSRIRIALISAGLALLPIAVFAQTAEFVGSYTWSGPTRDYGGFSGIEVSEDGKRFTVIGDRGAIVDGVFTRNGQRITDVNSALQKIKNHYGSPVLKPTSDAEGLAIRADGRVFISFENSHRVRAYQQIGSNAQKLAKHPDFKQFSRNSGLEALAVSTDGTLFALPEHAVNSVIQIYRYKNGRWGTPFQIPAVSSFKPVGADFGPDGKFYLLERSFTSVFGFESQIRRFEINGNQISDGEVVLQTSAGTHGNLEGIALWQDARGDIRLTMIADDNFIYFQNSEFVEYRLQE